MNDIFGRVLMVLSCFVLIFLVPFIAVATSNATIAERTILNEMQSFLDEVIDTRQVTDAQLEDLYLGISGLGVYCDVEVERYVRTVEPDPKKAGGVYVTYVYSENNRKYNQGDKVKVRVHAIGYTGTHKLLRFLGETPHMDYALAGRVR